MGDQPPTRGKRFLKLFGMTASVAARQAKTRLEGLFQDEQTAARARQQSYRDAGGRIAATLGELKGAVMKVGQMASMAADVLPKELALPLRQLQKRAPPMSYEIIAKQIAAELGDAPERLFARFDRQPFASASIGQVHCAVTDDGRDVICKVQYPGVEGAVDSDLMQLELALRAAGLAHFGRRALEEAFAELRHSLHDELDYCREADSVRAFRAFHGERHPFLAVPDVVAERSSQRVLTLTYEAGDTLDELGDYSQSQRDRLGENLTHLIASEIFVFHCFHADPHPGNFAFRRDGTVVVYDFGCVKDLPVRLIRAYRDCLVCGLEEDYAGVELALRRLGARNIDGPPVPAAYYRVWRNILAAPFLGDRPFDFGSSNIHGRVVEQIPGMFEHMTSFLPAKDLIFLDRTVGGHYGNLRALRARVPVMQIIQPYLDALDAADPR